MTYERLVHYHCGDGKIMTKKAKTLTRQTSLLVGCLYGVEYYGMVPYHTI